MHAASMVRTRPDLSHLNQDFHPRYAASKDPGDGVTYEYKDVWDAEMIYGCKCDDGFAGVDCSQQTCPLGDDPLTGVGIPTAANPTQFNDIQSVFCTATSGTFTLTFRGKTTVPLPYNAQAADVVAALQQLPTINGVTVVMYGSQACLETQTSFTIEFRQEFSNLPLTQVDGSKLRSENSIAGIRVQKQQAGTKENLPCSSRGICDVNTGYCTCSTNYGSSNGYNLPGTRGDCGYTQSTIQGCPGAVSCSAHGACSGVPTFACLCNEGWQSADCSEKSCPRGSSWFTFPADIDTAHVAEYNECSDMGSCDRSSGTCTCVNGFTGAGCNRLQCPGDPNLCSGHGDCQDLMTLAAAATVNGVNPGFTYGMVPNNPKTWDYNRMFGCNCNSGWNGYDCSLRMCLTGDDPNTKGQRDAIQSISCSGGTGGGFFVLTFRMEATIPIPSSASSMMVKAALEALSTVTEVAVELGTLSIVNQLCSSTPNEFYVSFLTEHGPLPLLQITSTPDITMAVRSVVEGSKEDIECSGRGLCDSSTGICSCFLGYGASDGKGGEGLLNDCGYVMPLPYVAL